MFDFLLAAIDKTYIITGVIVVLLLAVFILFPMFTNKRRNKAINELHASLRPGDVIKTVGGIVGTIIDIREISPVDKEMVLETGVGDNKSTMVFDIQAIYQVLTKKVDPESAPVSSSDTTVTSGDGVHAETAESASDAPAVDAESVPAEEKTEAEVSATVDAPVSTVAAEEPAPLDEEAATKVEESAADVNVATETTGEADKSEAKPAAPKKPAASGNKPKSSSAPKKSGGKSSGSSHSKTTAKK